MRNSELSQAINKIRQSKIGLAVQKTKWVLH